MDGVDSDYVASFKFFQINKSKIRTQPGEGEKIMLALVDISQKILYDTSKA